MLRLGLISSLDGLGRGNFEMARWGGLSCRWCGREDEFGQ